MNEKSLSRTTHDIFDFGQTLIDGKSNIESVIHDYALSKGKVWKFKLTLGEENLAETDSFHGTFQRFLESIGDDSYGSVGEFEKMVFQRVFDMKIQMMSGVKRLVDHLYEHNIPMTIATNSTLPEFKVVVQGCVGFDTRQYTHVVCGGDDLEVKENKPAPDIYFVCTKRFSPPPKSMENCIIFEDSIRGITGAVNTGMKSVLINDTDITEIGSIVDKITVIIDSFNNFKPESVGLPPFE